jgi:hypothetical protein
LLIFLGIMVAVTTGCPRNEYVVEMKPLGAHLERKLTAWREDGQESNGAPKFIEFPKEELALLKALYPKHESANDGKQHSFIGQFAGNTPNDVGGHGGFTNFVSTLGTGWIYVERFRGNDNLVSQINQATTAADQLVDLIEGWTRTELARQAKYKDLRQFLTQDVRQDLKNLSLYCWAGSLSSRYKTETENEFVMRVGQYLVERDYFRAADLPQVLRASQANDPKALMLLVRRLVARKLSVPEPQSVTGPLAFLADDATASASLRKYLRTTDAYRVALNQWKKDRTSDPQLQEPDPLEIASGLVQKLVEFGLWRTTDHLKVRLAAGGAPADSNGRWDEKTGELVWDTSLEERQEAREFPIMCYATWSAPDEVFQEKLFGKTVLSGKKLFEYCLWRQSLDTSESKEWDQFLSALTPESFKARLDAFRFSAEAAQKQAGKESPPTNLSDVARQLINSSPENSSSSAK